MRKDDGTEVDVSLDKDLKVVGRDADDRDDDDDDCDDDDLREDADDRALSASERTSAENAALNAVDGGTVTEVEASDDSARPTRSRSVDRRHTSSGTSSWTPTSRC